MWAGGRRGEDGGGCEMGGARSAPGGLESMSCIRWLREGDITNVISIAYYDLEIFLRKIVI